MKRFPSVVMLIRLWSNVTPIRKSIQRQKMARSMTLLPRWLKTISPTRLRRISNLWRINVMKKVAVILSGCGVFDGAEIHESVLALHAIEKQGASWHCFAPNVQQMHVINHLTGEEMPETRNVLVESARIARGKSKM